MKLKKSFHHYLDLNRNKRDFLKSISNSHISLSFHLFLPGNRLKRSRRSIVSITAFDLNLYGIWQNREKIKVLTTGNVNIKKWILTRILSSVLNHSASFTNRLISFIKTWLSIAVFLTHGSESQRDTINSIHSAGGGWRLPWRPCFFTSICRLTSSWLQEIDSGGTLSPNHISHIINPKLYMSTLES